jgi:O-antigen/teichoic acid export membrane protein
MLRAFEVLTGFGPDRYLVQKEAVSPDLVGTVWLFAALRGLAGAAFIFAAAPLYAGIVDAPEAVPVFHIVAGVPFFNGLVNATRYLAERELAFGRIAAYETISSVFDAALTIALAWWLRDMTALAWGMCAAAGASALLSYALFALPRGVSVSASAFKEIFSVGRYLIVVSVGTYVMTQGDNLIVGWLLGPVHLGYYALAYQLAELPVQVYGKIANRVALPLFSRLQSEPERARALFGDWVQAQMLLLVPTTALFALFAPILVVPLYGENMANAAPALTALAIVTAGRGFSHIIAPYLLAMGRFAFSASVKWLEVGVFVVAVLAGTRTLGLVGAGLGAGLGYVVAAIVRGAHVISVGDLRLGRLGRTLAANVAASSVASLAAWGVLQVVGSPPWLALAAVLTTFALVFAAASFAVQGRDLGRLLRIFLGQKR